MTPQTSSATSTRSGGCAAKVNANLNVVWGVQGAGLIFRDIFNSYEAAKPVKDFAVPEGLKKVTVCKASGLKATASCAGQTFTDWFIAGTAPNRDDDWYRQVRVCTTDGLLATPDIPQNFTALKTFLVYPPGYPDELKDKNDPQAADAELPAADRDDAADTLTQPGGPAGRHRARDGAGLRRRSDQGSRFLPRWVDHPSSPDASALYLRRQR